LQNFYNSFIMKRKDALKGLLGAGLLVSSPLFAQPGSPEDDDFLPLFARRWQNTVDYSLEVMGAMPEDFFAWQPTPEMLSFGKQFTHAAYWSTFLFGSLVKKEALTEPKAVDKGLSMTYVADAGDFCAGILEELDPGVLYQSGLREESNWADHKGMDFLLRAYMHMAHHRGQGIVYLRAKGLRPPEFRF
jgi:hypothetical protein